MVAPFPTVVHAPVPTCPFPAQMVAPPMMRLPMPVKPQAPLARLLRLLLSLRQSLSALVAASAKQEDPAEQQQPSAMQLTPLMQRILLRKSSVPNHPQPRVRPLRLPLDMLFNLIFQITKWSSRHRRLLRPRRVTPAAIRGIHVCMLNVLRVLKMRRHAAESGCNALLTRTVSGVIVGFTRPASSVLQRNQLNSCARFALHVLTKAAPSHLHVSSCAVLVVCFTTMTSAWAATRNSAEIASHGCACIISIFTTQPLPTRVFLPSRAMMCNINCV
jgi:hypothetical protein